MNDIIYCMEIRDFLKKNQDRTAFSEHAVKSLLKDMGLPVPKGIFIKAGETIPQQLHLKYPLVAKVSSPEIISKSDAKGIRSGIGNENNLKKAVIELMRIGNAEGVLVEEMALQGLETIVGGVIDKQFGPVLMFGLGGLFVELFKDTAFCLVPLKKEDALWLIQQVKGYKLIQGYRGNPAVDKDALIDIILAVSEIMSSGVVEEIDLNPVSLYPHGALILDAKVAFLKGTNGAEGGS